MDGRVQEQKRGWFQFILTMPLYLRSSMHAIREGMVWLIPCLMISSLALFFATLADFYFKVNPPWVALLFRVYEAVSSAFPYLMSAAIAYILAMQWRLPRPPVALLNMVFILMARQIVTQEQALLTFQIIMAILTPLYTVPLLAVLMNQRRFRLTSTASAGAIVRESLNLVLPALITAVIVALVDYILFKFSLGMLSQPLVMVDYANKPFMFGTLFAACNSLLWFFGIHGYYALLPWVDLLQEAVDLNYSTVAAGGTAPYIMNLSFMSVFVFIGGSGATLALVLSILLFTRQKTTRLIALAALPLSFLNVNEILLFGLPLIFNPRLVIPFLVVPVTNVVIGLVAVSAGLVNVASMKVSFVSPVLVNAWIATDGDWNALFLQGGLILLDVLLYCPFVLRMNRMEDNYTIAIPSLDTSYMRRKEEAETLQADSVSAAYRQMSRQDNIEQHLHQMSNMEFSLEYQPQLCSVTQHVTGSEALIRAKDSHGHVLYPEAFMPWLEQAGLMKEIDLWVFRQVIQDIRYWNRQGVFLPVSVNLTPETLSDRDSLQQIVDMMGPYTSQIHIEVTEETLLIEHDSLQQTLGYLREKGCRIYIDDFGTGYSSLSYLNQFHVDAIKIDRAFVQALNEEKGRKIFHGLINLARSIGLSVIVEGVESDEQLAWIDCDYTVSLQGWYFSKSLDREQFVHYVHSMNPVSE